MAFRNVGRTVISFTVLLSCSPAGDVGGQVPAAIGLLVRLTDGSLCVTVARADLTEGSRVAVAFVPVADGGRPLWRSMVEILDPIEGECGLRFGEPGEQQYAATISRDGPEPQTPAVAVVGEGLTLVELDGDVGVDIDGDGTVERFRSCTSSEGLHLTSWAGEPLRSARLWHRYYYLGYDVEPSCTEADYAPDRPPSR